jgi:Cu(I)/Ag(I) efflux system protein CusF
MKKSMNQALAAIILFSATAAMAQQTMMDGMKGMSMGKPEASQAMHMARGKVVKVDAHAGVVTLAHQPIKSLNWPAMTMGFQVKDKMLLDKLTVGKTVDFELVQADKGYVITSVK